LGHSVVHHISHTWQLKKISLIVKVKIQHFRKQGIAGHNVHVY